MRESERNQIEQAVTRAKRVQEAGLAVWVSVFADVMDASGEFVGHIVSHGYTHSKWDFYPREDIRKASRYDYKKQREQRDSGKSFRREIKERDLGDVVPKWVGEYTLANVETSEEKRKRRRAEERAEERREMRAFVRHALDATRQIDHERDGFTMTARVRAVARGATPREIERNVQRMSCDIEDPHIAAMLALRAARRTRRVRSSGRMGS